jgi:hypothetical protein
MNDGQASGKAIDTHIQEAAEGQPQCENRQSNTNVHRGLLYTLKIAMTLA